MGQLGRHRCATVPCSGSTDAGLDGALGGRLCRNDISTPVCVGENAAEGNEEGG
jgi:hypothetical protein